MNFKIFVTGATGNVGSEVVKYLLKSGVSVIGGKSLFKNPEAREGVEWRSFDFTDQTTWEPCLEGVDRVFLMRPPHISHIKRDMLPFLNHLKSRNVRQVVFLSVQGAEGNKIIPHHKVEQYLMSLEIPYTILRPSFFMQNLTTTHLLEIRDEKCLFVPSGEGKTNFIDVRDIGEIAARIFVQTGHIGKAYTITGMLSYSHREIAEHLSNELGQPIHFISPGPIHFISYHLKKSRKLGMILVMLVLYTVVRLGRGDVTTPTSQILLGRNPRSLQEFIKDSKDVLIHGKIHSNY
ncbi:NmrA family NAD(P)-binding protein [Oceanispirochaeta sp.]|jgi:uncharacterized protein YbjT (DUF2867 family)|uniref:NmrA family NAD(P)-binding protein n=1 Tax=Oceanispirochaeta sp. TaxID=2035350 RepID=UPI002616D922|nr:NmrA family NAD(P)-binding protein [Oceanispirochaeta sp.]MDA3955148.1 NmrA family NAD(P)-binding protein [Oceanispirochaeta sp.]